MANPCCGPRKPAAQGRLSKDGGKMPLEERLGKHGLWRGGPTIGLCLPLPRMPRHRPNPKQGCTPDLKTANRRLRHHQAYTAEAASLRTVEPALRSLASALVHHLGPSALDLTLRQFLHPDKRICRPPYNGTGSDKAGYHSTGDSKKRSSNSQANL